MRDTIDMAREAGGCDYGNANPDIESTFILKDDQIKAFEALVRVDEREACAKLCDRMAARCNDIRAAALESAAENIRARGNT